jgi:hypothetical protein
MNGERGLPMKTLDVLAEHLDLNIVAGGRRRKGWHARFQEHL